MKLFKFIIVFTILFSSCTENNDTENNSCQDIIDISTSNQMQKITYSSNIDISIDINNDGKDDFKFVSELAGNRYARIFRSVNNQNKIVAANFLEVGATIDNQSTFVEKIDLNNIESGFGNDYKTLSNKFIGLKIVINGEEHFGWIQFSSTDSDPRSPTYYSDLEIVLESFAFNKGCAAIVIN